MDTKHTLSLKGKYLAFCLPICSVTSKASLLNSMARKYAHSSKIIKLLFLCAHYCWPTDAFGNVLLVHSICLPGEHQILMMMIKSRLFSYVSLTTTYS